MDQRIFDAVARTLGRAQDRRHLTGIASLGLAVALGVPVVTEAKKSCKKKKKSACTGKCGSVTYKCNKKRKSINCGPCGEFTVCKSGCPFNEVYQAIEAANPGATINVGPGTYSENIYIEKNITLIGAGTNQTIIDGKGKAAAIGLEPSLTAVTIRDMTLTNGHSTDVGGGLSNGKAQTTLVNVLITGNIADERGGGIDVDVSGKVTMTNCTITNNHAGQAGGGTYTLGALICSGTTYSGNTSGDPEVSDNCTQIGAGSGCNTCAA